jgi:phospholipid/cholesterol/gamma-HCH transport system permease protein
MNLNIFYHFGQFLLLLKSGLSRPENMRMYWQETVRQMYDIGVGSLTIVALISVFIGAVTAVQFSYQLGSSFVPMYYIGYIVRDSAIIELAPTITCLVLAGKVGSNMAAEIGGMRQKEHIDAMEIMGVNTASYLLVPRLLAALTMIPLLVSLAAFISIVGGYLSTVTTGIISNAEYVQGVRSFFVPYNVTMMYVKAVVFSFILTSISSYQGYYVKGGSIELGQASTNAVVFSDIMILVSDYLIALILT